MKVRNIAVLFVLIVVAMFAAANWATFAQPTTLNLLFGSVEAPLGFVMLVVIAGLTLLYGAFFATLETQMLLESRRQTKSLEEARMLAEATEASRIRELQHLLEREMGEIKELLVAALKQPR
jgi:uncharacterized integral membrane protein